MVRRQRGDGTPETPPPVATSPGALATIRAEARAELRDCPEVTAIDALLVADILATDAIRCGRAVHRARFHRQFSRLLVEVTSTPSDGPPAFPASTDDGISRLLLEELTRCWDVEHGERFQTVWADLDVAH